MFSRPGWNNSLKSMNHMLWLPLLAFLTLSPTHVALSAATNHNFARWEKAIAAFERADATNPPPKNALLFIGSSTIAGWRTLAKDFPEHRVINRGFGGSQIVDSTYFAERVIFPYAPSAIFLRAGGNDLWLGKSPEVVFGDFTNFVATVHAKLPETDICFISLSPSIARWKQKDQEKALNTLVQEFIGQKPHLKYIESYSISLGADGQARPELFVSDKLHFNAEGYKLLVAAVRPHLPKPSAPPVATPK